MSTFVKKSFAVLLAFLLLSLSLCIGVLAAPGEDGDYLVDMAGIFTSSEKRELSDKLAKASEELGFDIVFITTLSTDGYSVQTYTDRYYLSHDYSYDAIVFLADMNARRTHFTTGGACIQIFTDYGLDYLLEDIGECLADGEYSDAVERLIDNCRSFKAEADEGTPYDVNHKLPAGAGTILMRGVLAIVIGFVIAFIVTASMKGQLKSVRGQAAANTYTRAGSMNLTESRDLFLYANVTRTAIPKNDSSSGRGGGSSTHSSGGRSLGGRSGSF